MKKILILAALVLLVGACGKDNTPSPTPPPTENPGDPTTTPPTLDELKSYFKISDNLTVAQAVGLVAETTGKQTVNGKEINVTQSSVTARNEQEGKFTATVKGTISAKTFSKEYIFEGLIKKPSDYNMAMRAQAQWKSEFAAAPEATPFAFDELYHLNDKAKFTTQYLSQWVDFYSSAPEGGNLYIFTDEDLAQTEISEINYNNGFISFIISYKGTKGDQTLNGRPALTFDKNKYYKRKVTINTDNIKKLYMQGVYENLGDLYTGLVNIENPTLFYTELVPNSKTYDSSTNTIGCQLVMAAYDNADMELAQFDFKFEGFKPLSDLKQMWILATTTELNTYMRDRVGTAADGDVLSIINRYQVSAWISKAQMAVQRSGGNVARLYLGTVSQGGFDVTAWIGGAGNKDILLVSPYFEVLSAVKTGNTLQLQVALTSANDVTLTDVTSPLEVRL